jgi:hypothetical protein
MRVSSDHNDAGFRIDHQRFTAYLDDKPQPFCITADETEGEAIIAVTDENGVVLYDNEKNPITETRYGRVEIVATEDIYGS